MSDILVNKAALERAISALSLTKSKVEGRYLAMLQSSLDELKQELTNNRKPVQETK